MFFLPTLQILKKILYRCIFHAGIITVCFLLASCATTGLQSREAPIQSAYRNSAPIILIPGFTGFGSSEDVLLHYWGGLTNIPGELRAEGYTIFLAPLDPLASNWDRACELYAFIKGGTVDYGEVHSAKYGHQRFGKTYTGVYPEWGTIDLKTNTIRSVHLIGHSMGAQTARVLASLLYYGDPDEALAVSSSELFTGNTSSVLSVLSISGTHNGTSLMYRYYEEPERMRLYLSRLETTTSRIKLVDWQMGLWHWPELQLQDNENVRARNQRAIQSSILWEGKDSGFWDLHPEGAAALNKRFPAVPDTYYFSWASSRTNFTVAGTHVPKRGILFYMHDDSHFMGRFKYSDENIYIDKHWFENDGVVNTYSMIGPIIWSTDRIITNIATPQQGVWNYLGVLKNTDHHSSNGIFSSKIDGVNKKDWYRQEIQRLLQLPPLSVKQSTAHFEPEL